jgi:hypothetical protein
MLRSAIGSTSPRAYVRSCEPQRDDAPGASCVGTSLDLQEPKEEKMTLTSKTFSASAAALFAFAFLAMTAPAAKADDFCIINGAQTAHGCGYPTMAACQAASAGMGGMCSPSASNKNPNDAQAKQQTRTHVKKNTTTSDQ